MAGREEAAMDSATEKQRAIVAEHIRLENAHDWQGVRATFVQDQRAHYDVVPLGARFEGVDAVDNFYRAIANAVPDLHIEVASEFDVPGCSIREIVLTGTHKGDYFGMKPMGHRVRVEMACFFTCDVDSGKLLGERIYFDQAGVAEQMQGGQKPALQPTA
jgi:predicted ester cyclase